jgi:2-dehydropantoate 2-reductase
MKIFILGAGAVGSYFGAALSLGGHEVICAVRDARRTNIQSDGIRLTGPRGDFHARNVLAVDKPHDVESVDVALSCVKLYDAQRAAEQWSDVLSRATAVISLQNGIDGAQRTLAGAPRCKAFGGLAFVSGKMESPGVVQYMSDMSSLVFGGPGSEVLRPFADALNEISKPLAVRAELVADIRLAQWSKFLALATNAALTCLARANAGVVYRDPDLLRLASQSIREIYEVGVAEGVRLEEGAKDAALKALQALPSGMVASMHHDLMSGRPLELDGLSGLVCRLGKRHGIPTPFHDFAYACLKPHLSGASAHAETR